MGWLSDNNVPGGKLMETFGKKVGETAKDGLDDFTTSSLIKKCESELETTKADDIPVGADVSTETGKLIQLALKIDNVNGKVGEDTIEVLNKLGLSKGEIDCIVGGPPCQGFSKNVPATYRFLDDSRNQLFRYFLDFVETFQPKTVFMSGDRIFMQRYLSK